MMHCGAPQLRNIDNHHAFSFDHLVGAGEQIGWSFKNGILQCDPPEITNSTAEGATDCDQRQVET